MLFQVRDRNVPPIQQFPRRGQSRLSRQQQSRCLRHLEFISAVGSRGDLPFQFQTIPLKRIPLVTPILHRRAGQRMPGGVHYRAGALYFRRAGAGARIRLSCNRRPLRRLGARTDAQQHRGGGNQQKPARRFHRMIRLLLFFERQRHRLHLERAEDFDIAKQGTLHIFRLPP